MLALLLFGVISTPLGYFALALNGVLTARWLMRMHEQRAALAALGLPPHLDQRFTNDTGPGA